MTLSRGQTFRWKYRTKTKHKDKINDRHTQTKSRDNAKRIDLLTIVELWIHHVCDRRVSHPVREELDLELLHCCPHLLLYSKKKNKYEILRVFLSWFITVLWINVILLRLPLISFSDRFFREELAVVLRVRISVDELRMLLDHLLDSIDRNERISYVDSKFLRTVGLVGLARSSVTRSFIWLIKNSFSFNWTSRSNFSTINRWVWFVENVFFCRNVQFNLQTRSSWPWILNRKFKRNHEILKWTNKLPTNSTSRFFCVNSLSLVFNVRFSFWFSSVRVFIHWTSSRVIPKTNGFTVNKIDLFN